MSFVPHEAVAHSSLRIFRDITPGKDPVKEFEIRKGDLRVYAIKDEAGHIVILGGKKSTQHEDINWFRSIKKRYLE